MDDLLTNRWLERNRELDGLILASQNEMNRRGIPQSTIAVQSLHEVFREEFHSSRGVIVQTIVDSVKTRKSRLDRQSLEKWAIDKLGERRDFLDALFRERGRVTLRGLQNEAMMAPYSNVDQYYEHACQELAIELNEAINEYERSLGATLTDRILNNFKNHPLVAFGIVIVTVLLALFGLISALRQIGS